jgi:hypothetical protein
MAQDYIVAHAAASRGWYVSKHEYEERGRYPAGDSRNRVVCAVCGHVSRDGEDDDREGCDE